MKWYICKAKCPELDFDELPHCETTDPETTFEKQDGCPVGNIAIWVEVTR